MMAIKWSIYRWIEATHGSRGLLLIGLCLLAMSGLAFGQKQVEAQAPYLIGRCMVDITGPEVGMPLWGFG